jgi:nucleoside transporter
VGVSEGPGNAPPRTRRLERWELAALFFVHAGAVGMWQVCFGSVLKAYGLEHYIAYAYACSAVSAFISPMVIGALADQFLAPARLLRWLAAAAAVALALAFTAIEQGWNPLLMLLFLQLHSLCATPTASLSTSIVLARLDDPRREFGGIRVWATFGWMAAGCLVSWGLAADASTRSGFAAAITWAGVALISFFLPNVPPKDAGTPRSLRDLFGLEALQLFRNRDHRAVFITAALFNAPLAAFYPYTPIHLQAVGVQHATAVMSLGQIGEVICMLGLAAMLVRVRLKTVFLAGIVFAIVRYALFALNDRNALLIGVLLHGFAFTLYFITAQIYLEQRIDPRLRARAQALLTLMISGFGNLIGYLGSGWWREACRTQGANEWPLFWGGLCISTIAVFVFFFASYRGQAVRSK